MQVFCVRSSQFEPLNGMGCVNYLINDGTEKDEKAPTQHSQDDESAEFGGSHSTPFGRRSFEYALLSK